MVYLQKNSDFINLDSFKHNKLKVYCETKAAGKTNLVNDLLSFNDDIDFSNVLQNNKHLNEKNKKGKI